jgi:hypothetical protein
MVDSTSFCREICEQHLMDHPMQIGGLDQNDMSVVVEIDASKFFHRKYKYNRGQWREGHWVFGGVERNSEKCFLVEVPDRTEVTLLGIILVERYSDVLRDTVLLIKLLFNDICFIFLVKYEYKFFVTYRFSVTTFTELELRCF